MLFSDALTEAQSPYKGEIIVYAQFCLGQTLFGVLGPILDTTVPRQQRPFRASAEDGEESGSQALQGMD